MKTTSSVTVIVPVKNGENHITEAIKSVINQTRSVEQIIVIDDHSTDNTLNLAMKFPNVDIIKNISHGQSAAINYGLKFAKSTYIGFIDHDDIWDPRKNERSLRLFEKEPQLNVVSVGVRNFEYGNTGSRFKDFGSSRVFGACLFEREVFKGVGPLDETINNHSIVEWWSRKNAENLKIGNIEETLYYRRIHDKNSGKISRDMARKDLFSILRKSKVGDVYNDRTQN